MGTHSIRVMNGQRNMTLFSGTVIGYNFFLVIVNTANSYKWLPLVGVSYI